LDKTILTTQSYNGVRWVLIDETDATLRDFSQEEIRIIRQRDDRLAAVLPELVAAVLAPKDFSFGMSRMWEMMTERPGWAPFARGQKPGFGKKYAASLAWSYRTA